MGICDDEDSGADDDGTRTCASVHSLPAAAPGLGALALGAALLNLLPPDSGDIYSTPWAICPSTGGWPFVGLVDEVPKLVATCDAELRVRAVEVGGDGAGGKEEAVSDLAVGQPAAG